MSPPPPSEVAHSCGAARRAMERSKYTPPHLRGGDDEVAAETSSPAPRPPPTESSMRVRDVVSAVEDEWERRAVALEDVAREGDADVTTSSGATSSSSIRGRRVEHVDVTCDGCEVEPIVGARYRCDTCEDRDLCGRCYRALCAARAQGIDALPPHVVAAVPCLRHTMTRVQGAERQLVLDLRPRPATPSVSASQAPASVSDLETPELDAVADDATTRAETERFLADVPASALRCDDLAWAVIERRRVLVGPERAAADAESSDVAADDGSSDGSDDSEDPTSIAERAIDACVRDWHAVLTSRAVKPSKREIDAIARRRNVLVGKWVAFPDTPEEADALWSATAREMAKTDGALAAAGAHAAKVSSRVPTKSGQVICVYTPNYQDDESVFAVRDAIRSACGWGSERRIVYKPDVYTHLGLYAGNELNLRPSVHVDGGPPKERGGGIGEDPVGDAEASAAMRAMRIG